MGHEILLCIAYTQTPLIRAQYAAGLEVYILRGSRGEGQGVQTPSLKNHKNTGVLSKTDPDPLKITKLPNRTQCWTIISTPVKRHLNGVSLAGRRWPASPLSSPHQLKKRCQSWTPSEKLCVRYYLLTCIV